jgi:hypothetical protein
MRPTGIAKILGDTGGRRGLEEEQVKGNTQQLLLGDGQAVLDGGFSEPAALFHVAVAIGACGKGVKCVVVVSEFSLGIGQPRRVLVAHGQAPSKYEQLVPILKLARHRSSYL